MDNTYMSKQKGGNSDLSRLLLLLFLAGLRPVVSSAGAYGVGNIMEVSIVGPDFVTVGVPASVECDANCPACTYSMSVDGQSAQGQGNVLAFTVRSWVEALTVTCTVTNDNTKVTETATKQLQVLVGPANVSITGPDLMNTSMYYNYSCQAHCLPSCTYAWKIGADSWIGNQGNMISVTPLEMSNPALLTCKAINSVSEMFVSATEKISVTFMEVSIVGPDYVTVGVPASVECDANCPACTYSMSVNGQSAQGQGNVLAFTVRSWVEALTVTCTVTNNNTKVTETVTKQLQVLVGPANVSITGPDLMNTSMYYNYSCHAYCLPSCTYAWKIGADSWIGNQGNMISVTPLEMSNPALLTCKAINSVSEMFVSATEKISVTFIEVSIVGPDFVTVGVPASVECDANCPACTYSMSVNGQSAQGQGNVLAFTVRSWVEALTVTCTVTNNNTKVTETVTKQLQVLVGPANVSITGPDMVNTSMEYIYSCQAHCVPSCTYAWKLGEGSWTDDQGNNISITFQGTSGLTPLTCKAINSVSGMFVSATEKISVTYVNLSPRPEETSAVLLLGFIISVFTL